MTPPPPPTIADFSTQLVRLVDVAYGLGGIFFLILFFVIGGIWMTSRGSEDVLTETKKRLTYWFAGFFLYFLSATLIIFSYDLFGVRNCLGERPTPAVNILQERACPRYRVLVPGAGNTCNTGESMRRCLNPRDNSLVVICYADSAPVTSCDQIGLSQ